MVDFLQRINANILTPALHMLPVRMDTPEARVMLLAIGMQESRFTTRDQINRGKPAPGPAMGLWQFERGGGVLDVLTNPHSKRLAFEICAFRGVAPAPRPVWTWLAEDDLLACAFARLLLWNNPDPLPALGRGAEAWQYYVDTWKPGKPHKKTWNGFYAQAMNAVTQA